jgi:hypothetical protein
LEKIIINGNTIDKQPFEEREMAICRRQTLDNLLIRMTLGPNARILPAVGMLS